MAVKQDIPTTTIKYKKDRSDETAELERLVKERAGILEQQKTESEDSIKTKSGIFIKPEVEDITLHGKLSWDIRSSMAGVYEKKIR